MLEFKAPEDVGMSSKKLSFVDKVIEEGIDEEIIPGAVLLVGKKGRVVYWKAYGYREIEPEKKPMEKDTIFGLASITKVVATTPSLMVLLEDGKISLDDRVTKYMPEFGENGKGDITLRELLTHSSGLSNRKFDDTPEKIVERICEEEPVYETGSGYLYSCLGYIILGKIVEKESGDTLAQFAREKLFEPLGMTDTMFNPPEELWERCAPSVYREGRMLRGKVNDMQAYVMGGVAGNAGLFSTAYDLAIFAQCILNGGVYNNTRILDAQTVKMMTSKASPDNKRASGGWDVDSPISFVKGCIPSGHSFGHTGYTGGTLWIYPEMDLFTIFLSNRVHPKDKPNGSIITKQLSALINDAVLRAQW